MYMAAAFRPFPFQPSKRSVVNKVVAQQLLDNDDELVDVR